MTHPQSTISLSELREALAQRGVKLTDSQLKRRRREGLVDAHQQRHEPGLRGSASSYSARSVEQLELVQRLASHERRFAQLAVLVRWHGGWVRPDRLRTALIDILDPMSASARELTSAALDDDERTDLLAGALAAAPGRAGTTKLMRRRLRNTAEDFERTLYVFGALAINSELEWENHDPENRAEPLVAVVERALGIDRARTDDIGGNGALLRGQDSGDQILGELHTTGMFDLLNLAAALKTASDGMIDRAFEDAIACAGGLADTFNAIQVLAGDDIAGLGSFSALAPDEDATRVALLVRGLLLMRPLMEEGALESVLDAASSAGPQLQAATELALAFPQYQAFLGLRGADRLAALPADERKRVEREVRTYLEARPGLTKQPDSES